MSRSPAVEPAAGIRWWRRGSPPRYRAWQGRWPPRAVPRRTSFPRRRGREPEFAWPSVPPSLRAVRWNRCANVTGAGRAHLPRTGPGQLLHLVGIRRGDEPGPGQHREPAACGVGVPFEQVEEHDRQISLQVLLLIDCEKDLSGLDRGDDFGGEFERREPRAGPDPGRRI